MSGVPEGIYDPATTQRTYARLQEVAATALAQRLAIDRRCGIPATVGAGLVRRFSGKDERAVTVLDCRAELPLAAD